MNAGSPGGAKRADDAAFSERLIAWSREHGRHDLPWQHGLTDFRVWLSEIMLQQTQVGTVILYFERFVSAFPDVSTLAAASLDDVLHLWSGLGYYTRARNLHTTARILVDEHDGRFPQSLEALTALPARPATAPVARTQATYQGGEARIDGDEEQVHIVLGFPGKPFTNGVHYPLQIFSAVLGGGLSSRLFQEVRERRGLAYAVDAFHWPFSDCGIFGISAGTAPEDVGELVEVALDCLSQAARDVSEAEVARARAQMKVGLLASLESPGGKLEQMARQVLVFGRAIPREELARRLDAVTLADVRAAGLALLDGIVTVAAVGPLDDLAPAAALRAMLARAA